MAAVVTLPKLQNQAKLVAKVNISRRMEPQRMKCTCYETLRRVRIFAYRTGGRRDTQYCVLCLCILYVYVFLLTCTLTEVFPCFFLSCKANARVKLAKTGHGPHYFTLVCICIVRLLTHCGRVTQIYVFNTVKLGTSASSP